MKMKDKRLGKVVKVLWVDTTTIHDVAYSPEEIIAQAKPILVKSIGQLIHLDKEKAILVDMMYNPQDPIRSAEFSEVVVTYQPSFKIIQVIPRGCIRKIIVVGK